MVPPPYALLTDLAYVADIRKFHAVGDVPELDHLENVVGERLILTWLPNIDRFSVFSRNAPRSIPDTIASGSVASL